MYQKTIILFGLLIIVLSGCDRSHQEGLNTEFSLKFTQDVSNEPLSGRAVILFSKDTLVDPEIPSPFRPFITIGSDFKNKKYIIKQLFYE